LKDIFLEKLRNLEKKFNVKIIYAVESGSRAWGFESKDSDYDVRFIYVHPLDRYLSLDPYRDSIEDLNDKLFDFAGWDLKKALTLFRKSNAPLLEWLRSPFIYLEKYGVVDDLRTLSGDYFSAKLCIYHYLHMAQGNYKDYLQGDLVKIKKYFYMLRPLFACEWIEVNNTMPPMEFAKLFDVISNENVLNKIDKLLVHKANCEELALEPKIDILNEYIENQIEYYSGYVKSIPRAYPDVRRLDKLFVQTLSEVWDVKLEDDN